MYKKVTQKWVHEYDIEGNRHKQARQSMRGGIYMSQRLNAGIIDNCAILFFIILFLLLFTGRGFWGRAAANEVVE